MIRAAVLGSPISHSLSPALHLAAYRELGIEGEYTAIEVRVAQLESFLESRDSSWTGFSLTMPLKEEVLRIADEVDELAQRIQSANTLTRTPLGWRASTTDVLGFQEALNAHHVTDFSKVLIIGSGATARAAASACDSEERSICVLHRNSGREMAMRAAAPLSTIEFLPWDAPLPTSDLIINTTPAGVADYLTSKISVTAMGVYFESLYSPWPTKLLEYWRSLNGTAIDGLDLLVSQGIEQIGLLLGKNLDRAGLAPILREAGLKAIRQ